MTKSNIDYTDFEKSGKAKKDPADDLGKQGYWWKETEADHRGMSMTRAAQSLFQEQTNRRNLNLLHARLYGNFDMMGFEARNYNRGSIAAGSKMAFNVCEASIDTLAAKISKYTPLVRFQTNGAKFVEQRKGERLEKFTAGGFSYARVKQKNDLVFIDACVFGSGGYKFIIDDKKKVNVERVFVDEVLVDEADAKYGAPRQMFHGRLCHREKLAADFTDKAEQIMSCKPPDGVEQSGQGDMVQVWEAWHLPSSKSAGDGLHVIALDDGTEILCEKWKLQRFPFVFYHYKPRLLGFWGQGVCEILTGIQLEINRLVRSISEQLRRKAKGRTWIPLSAKVPPEHFTNKIGDLCYYGGNIPPTPDNANTIAPEEFQQLDRLYAKAFQIIGASEMSVSAKKPSGLDSGVAIREWEDVESERFAKQHQRWDYFHVELAETWLDFVREFGGKGYVTNYEHKRYMETIKGEDVMMEAGEYAIHAFPSSSLPQTPAARRQAVKELQADQIIDKATAQRLLDYPDLEAEANLGNAARDDVDALIYRILNTNTDAELPDKFTDLQMFVERGTASYLFARNHDVEPERLDRLAAAIEAASTQLIETANAAAMDAAPDATATGMPPSPSPMPGAPAGGMPPEMNQTMNVPVQPTVPPLITQ